MTKKIASFLVVATMLAFGAQLSAEETSGIGASQRIVVITDDEGIHYQHGCAFYQLRDLLAANEGSVSESVAPTGEPLFEVRTLGRSGNSVVYIGDHWMRTSDGIALLPTETFDRIIHLVNGRKGQGVTKADVEASIRKASRFIQDATYVEENWCDNRSRGIS